MVARTTSASRNTYCSTKNSRRKKTKSTSTFSTLRRVQVKAPKMPSQRRKARLQTSELVAVRRDPALAK
jgi:hypothetical protein